MDSCKITGENGFPKNLSFMCFIEFQLKHSSFGWFVSFSSQPKFDQNWDFKSLVKDIQFDWVNKSQCQRSKSSAVSTLSKTMTSNSTEFTARVSQNEGKEQNNVVIFINTTNSSPSITSEHHQILAWLFLPTNQEPHFFPQITQRYKENIPRYAYLIEGNSFVTSYYSAEHLLLLSAGHVQCVCTWGIRGRSNPPYVPSAESNYQRSKCVTVSFVMFTLRGPYDHVVW